MAFVKILVNQKIVDIDDDFASADGLVPTHPNFVAIMQYNTGRNLYMDRTGCFWFRKGFFESYYEGHDRPWDSRTDVELLTWDEMVLAASKSAFSLKWLPKLHGAFKMAGVTVAGIIGVRVKWVSHKLCVTIYGTEFFQRALLAAAPLISEATEGVLTVKIFTPELDLHLVQESHPLEMCGE